MTDQDRAVSISRRRQARDTTGVAYLTAHQIGRELVRGWDATEARELADWINTQGHPTHLAEPEHARYEHSFLLNVAQSIRAKYDDGAIDTDISGQGDIVSWGDFVAFLSRATPTDGA